MFWSLLFPTFSANPSTSSSLQLLKMIVHATQTTQATKPCPFAKVLPAHAANALDAGSTNTVETLVVISHMNGKSGQALARTRCQALVFGTSTNATLRMRQMQDPEDQTHARSVNASERIR